MKIVIIGDGKVGGLLTQILSEDGQDVTVVDANPKVLMRSEEAYDAISIHGSGTSVQVLREAEVDRADLLIAATSTDEINLLSCLLAKKIGCQNTIARVRNIEYSGEIDLLWNDLGLSFVINPDEICAREIFGLLQFPSFLEREYFANGLVEVVRITIGEGSPLKNISLVDLKKVVAVKALICGVEREGQMLIPSGEFVLRENDDIFVTANTSAFSRLMKELKLSARKVRRVVIVGGSRIAVYLAMRLNKINVEVKIIETDHSRCLTLAELLPFADIVEADGTEHQVLVSEDVFHADALISLINIDEENILLSILGKQGGIPRVITKCNRTQYWDVFRKMGVDTFISSKFISATEIVRYIRGMEKSVGSEMLTMNQIANGKAELLEFRVRTHSRLVGKPLAQLHLKKNTLIVSVTRGKEVIVPSGETVVRPGDLVVIVTAGLRILHLDEILADHDGGRRRGASS